MGLGLGLSSGDVLDSLGELSVTEGLLGVEGGSHTRGGGLEESISVGTVGSHLGTDTTETGSRGSNNDLELVVGPLADSTVLSGELGAVLGAALGSLLAGVGGLLVVDADGMLESLAGSLGVLLDLGRVGSDVLVGLVDPGVDVGLQGSHGALLCIDLDVKVLGSLGLVTGNSCADLLGARDVGSVTLVSESGRGGELSLGATHGIIKVLLGLLGVSGHLGEEELVHLLARRLVEGKVAGHLGADRGDIALAGSLLSGDLLLNVVEIGGHTHATVRGVGVDLLHLLESQA